MELEGLISGDDYVFIREVYLQRREFLVHDGQVEDTFADFSSGFEEEEFEDMGLDDEEIETPLEAASDDSLYPGI